MSTPNLPMAVGVSCEKGRREENQDWLSWVQTPRGELFVVADGMGGHKGGAQAAHMTVEGVEKHLHEARPGVTVSQALQDAAQRTNHDVHEVAQSGDPETEKMGSTVVVALVTDGQAHIGHVGDSRAYLYRKGRLTRLTRDHTEVERMVEAGMLTPEEAQNHPDGHILTRAIGSTSEVEMDIADPLTLENGDALLLCSDGLSGFVEDEGIQRVLEEQPDVQRVPSALVALALEAGGSDNVTVQFVQFGQRVAPRSLARMFRQPRTWMILGPALGVALTGFAFFLLTVIANPEPKPPVVDEIRPATGESDTTVSVELTGSHFDGGSASIELKGAPGVTVENLSVDAETITADFVIEPNALAGARVVVVTTEHGSSKGDVTFEVTAPEPKAEVRFSPLTGLDGAGAVRSPGLRRSDTLVGIQ